MFTGREKELQYLNDYYEKSGTQILVVYHSNNTHLPDSRRGSICPKASSGHVLSASPDPREAMNRKILTWKPAVMQPDFGIVLPLSKQGTRKSNFTKATSS